MNGLHSRLTKLLPWAVACIVALLGSADSSALLAQCSCSLPADETCPVGCATCQSQSVSCQCTTACTLGSGICTSPNYTLVGTSTAGCAPFFSRAICQQSGSRQIAQCATCAPGRWGPNCDPCPGGASNPCLGHGTCSQGINGTGVCTCSAGFAGPMCQYSDAVTCNGHGVAQSNGSCVCNTGFTGLSCGSCATNYYSYPTCRFCQASATCSSHGSCNTSGFCACNTGFAGASCNTCATNYYSYPACTFCLASTTCNNHGTCNATGNCSCGTGFMGTSCNSCATDYYNYPTCAFCLASTTCNNHGTCNATGSCACSPGFAGAGCNNCATDYYNYPTCTFCLASSTCSNHGTCNATGSCACNTGFEGTACDTCAPGFFGDSCLMCGGATLESDCADGLDGDCDALTDCEDSDCCGSAACAGTDTDGDTYEGCDCNDANVGLWTPPGEVPDIALSHVPLSATTLMWTPPFWPGSDALTYSVLRYEQSSEFYASALCLTAPDPTETSLLEATDPTLSGFYFYLIRASNDCGPGPLGHDSIGNPRVGGCP